MPYRVFNASRYLPEVPDHLKPLVSSEGTITDEEASWGMYDLRHLSRVTPYNRFMERFGQLIVEIDTAMGTTFFDELQALATQENLEWESEKDEDTVDHVTSEPAASISAAPAAVARTRKPVTIPPATPVTNKDLVTFKARLTTEGFNQEEVNSIIGYNPDTESILERITYNVPASMLVACNHPGCGGPSPEFFHKCPHCLKEFE